MEAVDNKKKEFRSQRFSASLGYLSSPLGTTHHHADLSLDKKPSDNTSVPD
jgi:hypothetical protein